MLELLIGNDTAVITLLLLFIIGLLTKRFVPWWVHEEVLEKLSEYEKTAPELISEVQRLLNTIEQGKVNGNTPQPVPNTRRPFIYARTITSQRVRKGAKYHAKKDS